MAEGLMEPPPSSSSSSKPPADLASRMAAAAAGPADRFFGRRIDFHLERKPYSPISSSEAKNFYLETLNPSSSQPQREAAGGGAGPTSAAVAQLGRKSDGGFDPLFSFRINFRRIGAGLQNLGNTCYLNSVLQCLTYTEPLAAYCSSGEHKSSCRTAGFCAMCALQNHVTNALQSSGKILSPFHLVKNLRCISRNFRNSRQEDAHEYMVNLLESMHKCCLPSGVPTESPSAYEKSLVYKIFGGRLRSQVKCTQCHYCSNKFEPFLDLSLEIFKADSLRKALVQFTAAEQLDGGERQYQCQRCKEKVRAYKQLTIHKAPHVLTIHLKRFGPHVLGQKIDKKVEFEPTLNLKPFVSNPHDADLKYTLYGVLVHAGWSTHSGHYYCFVRTSSGMWHSLDDNQVRQVSEKSVLAQKAYMLFYVRNRSTIIRKPVEAARKDNILADSSRSKVVPQPASMPNGAIQPAKRKYENSECSLAKPKAVDKLCDVSTSLVINSFGQQNAVKDESTLKDSGCIPSQGASSLQAEGDVFLNGLPLSNCLKKSENALAVTPNSTMSSHCQKVIDVNPTNVKEAFVPESGDNSKGKSIPDISCKRSVVEEPNKTPSSNVASEKHSTNLQKQIHDQNINHNGDAKSEIFLDNGNSCHMDIHNESAKDDISKTNGNSCQLDTTVSVHKEKYHDVALCGHAPHPSGKLPSDDYSVRQDGSTITGGKWSQAKPKRKRHGKSFPKSQYLGGKKLFLRTLLMKKKKHKIKRHGIYSKRGQISEVPKIDDQRVSTSESNSVRNDGSASNNMNNVVLSTSNQPRENYNENFGDQREADACSRSLVEKGTERFLMSLKESIVPRWNDVELPSLHSNETENKRKSSIGYVPDEWDEEYDRGRRKKVKTNKRPFGGNNAFQLFADMKIQKTMETKANQIGSGNQPLRI